MVPSVFPVEHPTSVIVELAVFTPEETVTFSYHRFTLVSETLHLSHARETDLSFQIAQSTVHRVCVYQLATVNDPTLACAMVSCIRVLALGFSCTSQFNSSSIVNEMKSREF